MQERRSGCAAVTDDLILEILLRLPAKSVGRLRIVSKQWLTFTTSPEFIHAHASSAPISGFIIRLFFNTKHIPLDGASHLDRLSPATFHRDQRSNISNPDYFCRRAFSDGLPFCSHGVILDHDFGKDDGEQTPTFSMYNPMTRHLGFIPRPMLGMVSAEGLALDPIEHSRFKVAVWECEPETIPKNYRLHVYSSATQSWKILHEVDSKDWLQGQAVSWNGSLAWRSKRDSFLLLDAKDEKVRKMANPKLPCLYLGESRGRLHFIGATEKMDVVDVFEMESVSTGWSELYHHLDLRCMRECHYPEMIREAPLKFLAFVRGDSNREDELLLRLRLPVERSSRDNMVVSFLPRSKLCSPVLWAASEHDLNLATPHAHTLLCL